MNELTISEANRLTELECQMEQDQAAFVRYGNALLEIRESPSITTPEQANAAHKRIVATIQDAIAIGEFLFKKKSELPYGRWGK